MIALLSGNSFADYNVYVPLDGNKIIIKDSEVNGEIKLKNSTIKRGEETSIIWNYKYANKINIENIGSYNSKKGLADVAPLETTEYLITISNGKNNKQEKLTLNVIQPEQEITFTSDIQRIGIGQSAKLNWNVVNSNSASIDNGIGNVSLNSNTTVHPQSTTTYTLTAKGYTGISDLSKSLSIEVVPDSIINSFNVDKEKLTVGDTAIFNWNVEGSELLTFDGSQVNLPSGTKSILTTTVGNFDYTLESTNFSGTKINKKKSITVYPEPIISSFTVNGVPTTIKVGPNSNLNFNWVGSGFEEQLLDNVTVTGQSKTLVAPLTGSKDYVYINKNGAGKSIQEKITVNVIQPATSPSITAPSTVFANAPFTLSFSSSGATSYKIKSNNANSGISTNNFDLGVSTSTAITPTAAGTYVYTVIAINEANVETESTKTVVVESNPTFTTFTVNGSASTSVVQSTAITFSGSGYSTGATLQGMNSAGTAESNLPSTASSAVTTTTYYASAKKSLNGVTRYSPVKSVSVTTTSSIICPAYSSSNGVIYNGSSRYQTWRYGGVTVATLRSNAASVAAGGYTYTRSTYVGSAIIDEVGSSEEMYRICRQ